MSTLALLLCIVVLAHGFPHDDVHDEHHDGEHQHKIQKRAFTCKIDLSLPCECFNPFQGTTNFFLGDGPRNCESAKACYVKVTSGCADAKPARGGGRCQGKDACKEDPEQIRTTTTTTSAPTTTKEDCTGIKETDILKSNV